MKNEAATATETAAAVADQGATAPETSSKKKVTKKAAKPAAKKTAKKTASKPAAKKAPKPTSKKAAKPTATASRDGSKKQVVLLLLARKEGATMAEIADATGWQKHSIRGFISGQVTKKMGLLVESAKNAQGERTYRTK